MTELSSLVQPVIITFNRSGKLYSTLQAFLPLCRDGLILHVLDNASVDDTRDVVVTFQKLTENIRYRKNPINIGGNANIVRSIELSDSVYHWIVGDDDVWNFERVDELWQVVRQQRADIIRLGWLVGSSSRGKLLPLEEISRKEALFYPSCSMISATVIRRQLAREFVRESYANVGNFMPQLVPILKAASAHKKITVYSLESDLITHIPGEEAGIFVGDFNWVATWMRSTLCIDSPTERKRFVKSIWNYQGRRSPGLLGWVKYGLNVAFYSKSFKISQKRYFGEMWVYGEGVRAFTAFLWMVYLFTPRWAAWLAYKSYYRIFFGKVITKQEVAPRISSVRL